MTSRESQQPHCPECGLHSPCGTCNKPRLAVVDSLLAAASGTQHAAVTMELERLNAENVRLSAEVERLMAKSEELVGDFMAGTHDAFCAGDCGRLTANAYCRDCMVHGGVNAYDRLRLAEGFLAVKDAEIERLTKERDHLRVWLQGAGSESGYAAALEREVRQLTMERDDCKAAMRDMTDEHTRLTDDYEAMRRECVATGDAGESAVAVARRWREAAERERSDNEHLREALALMIEEAVDDWNGPPIRPSLAPGGHAIEKARAALDGRPVETLPVDDEAEARFEKLLAKRWSKEREMVESWSPDSRRALAERVREAAAKAIEACALNSWRVDADLVRALDLAPLLEESTEQRGGLTVRAGAPVCPACRGDGCTVCLGAGVDPSNVRPDWDEP